MIQKIASRFLKISVLSSLVVLGLCLSPDSRSESMEFETFIEICEITGELKTRVSYSVVEPVSLDTDETK